jgi:hypothetical protein
MQITKGTNASEDLFDELRKHGLLVDAYSEKWLSELENDREGGSQLEYVKQQDQDLGTDSINHLLIVYIPYGNELAIEQKIAAIYPNMSWLSDKSIHQPDFLFFNLVTRKILCAGLGKKNRFFVFDADNRDNHLGWPVDLMSSENQKLFTEFTKLDYALFVSDFLDNLEKLGQSNYFLANEWDGDEDSGEYMDADDGIFEAMNFFRIFFPMVEAEELDSEIND